MKRKNAKGCLVFIIIIAAVVIAFIAFANAFTKTPEYAVYNAVAAMKNGEYNRFAEYVDMDAVLQDEINSLKEKFMTSDEVKRFPDERAALEVFNQYIDENKENIKYNIKRRIETKHYASNMGNVPDFVFLVGVIKKQNGDYKMTFDTQGASSISKIYYRNKLKSTMYLQFKDGKWRIDKVEL